MGWHGEKHRSLIMLEELKGSILEANLELNRKGLVKYTWGKDASEAEYHVVLLEEVSQMGWMLRLANPDQPAMPQVLLDKHVLRKHGNNAYYGQK